MKQIRAITPEHIPCIAEIHLLAFPQSALTALGREAIRRYYYWLITGPHDSFLLGVWVDDLLEAYSFAGVFRGAISGYITQNKWYLFRQGIFTFRYR